MTTASSVGRAYPYPFREHTPGGPRRGSFLQQASRELKNEDFVPWCLLFLSGSGAKVIGAHRKGSQELLRVDYHLLQAQEG